MRISLSILSILAFQLSASAAIIQNWATTNSPANASNYVLSIAQSVGGPTNGVTATVATNIAAYQAGIATNGATGLVRSNALGSAAYTASTAYDASGAGTTAAQNATNAVVKSATGAYFATNLVSGTGLPTNAVNSTFFAWVESKGSGGTSNVATYVTQNPLTNHVYGSNIDGTISVSEIDAQTLVVSNAPIFLDTGLTNASGQTIAQEVVSPPTLTVGTADSDGAYPLKVGSDRRVEVGGRIAGGENNTAVGRFSLGSASAHSTNSTALGFDCLSFATNSSANTAVGYDALWAMISGAGNTALGSQPGLSNLIGNYNTLIGAEAGRNGTNQAFNTLIGGQAGYTGTSASNNVAVGYDAAFSQTIGRGNAILGTQAGYGITTGSSNVIIGNMAGYSLTTGSSNIIIGAAVDASPATMNGMMFLGNLIIGDMSVGTMQVGTGAGLSAQHLLYGTAPLLSLDRYGGYAANARFTIENIVGATSERLDFISRTHAGALVKNIATMLATGNVGIGVTEPTTLLSVAGTISAGATVTNIIADGGSLINGVGITNGTVTAAVTALSAGATINGANAQALTNIFLANVISRTNALTDQTIDFTIPEATTNGSAGITFTAISGFNPTNYNRAIRHIIANGADRAIAFPASWKSQGTCVATNGTTKDLYIECQIGFFTNVSYKSNW